MSNLDSRCLDAFPEWLRSLSEDALALGVLVADASQSDEVRRHVVGALNYLFKSLDLIPDGIEDLGFLDDAFVFRVAAAAATKESAPEPLGGLAEEAGLIAEFLGNDYARLERFVAGLDKSTARGRSVEDIVTDAAARSAFVNDVKGWANSYVVPSFGRDVKNLVKLRSFLATKLPA
jgi:uncharacterized membrane protein YkvA (DUF1232 family)